MIQSEDDDWIINSHPSGIDSACMSWLWDCRKCMFCMQESFLFDDLSPVSGTFGPSNKKITSLRPWRLCGDILILDKNKGYELASGIG
jgi:hypothetical protein